MPEDDLADEASQLAITTDEHDDDFQVAAKRLAQEAQKAQQALSYGSRGIKDVTEDFAAAAKQLQPGQLVKDDYFTLFEAVGALEIMDPKMDSGFVLPGDTMEPDFDPCQGLSAPAIIWIMDELLRLTIVWHDGHPLSQTVFTSLHIDRLISPDNKPPYHLSYAGAPGDDTFSNERLVRVVLRAFCVALVKSCALVLHTIQSQNFYEEEDFVTHLFGRELLPGIGADDAVTLLDEAVEYVGNAEDVSLGKVLRDALKTRLRFMQTYVKLLMDESNDWMQLSASMGHVEATHWLAMATPAAFSDKVQRQLATSTPPRPMTPITWNEAVSRWKRLCEDVAETNRLTSFEICLSSHSLQRAIWALAYREPQPNTFARARLQSILFASERIAEDMTFFDLLLADLRDLVLAGDPLSDPESFQVEAPSDPRHRCSRVMETFMDKAFDEYMNLYRMVCQNRCRIRRTFTQSIVIFDGLEREAMRSDAELNSIAPGIMWPPHGRSQSYLDPLTTWTKYYKLVIMAWTIQLGLETDIYLPHELAMMYWYLSTFASRRIDLLEHIQRFLEMRAKTFSPGRHPSQYGAVRASQSWVEALQRQAQVTMLISRALWQLCATLMAAKVIEPPKQDFAQERLLYDVRMKSYLGIVCDPIPTLDEYKRSQSAESSISKACAGVSVSITEAKGHLAELKKMDPQRAKYVGTEEQWKREVKQLETTCVAIAVQNSQLRRVAGKQGVLDDKPCGNLKGWLEASVPLPGKRYHDWWAVPQVKEKKGSATGAGS